MLSEPALAEAHSAAPDPETCLYLDPRLELARMHSHIRGQDWLLTCGDRHFAISDRMADLVRSLQREPSLTKLAALLRERWEVALTAQELAGLIRGNLSACLISEPDPPATAPARVQTHEFAFSCSLVSAAWVERISRLLLILYDPRCMLIGLAAACSCAAAAWHSGFHFRRSLIAEQLIWGYAISGLITLFHELGHTTAQLREFGRTGPIRFGIYYVLPVMFVPMSDTYAGSRRQRVLVDAGGIYFQALLVIPLYLLRWWPGYPQPLYEAGLTVNLVILAFNLNPFFKFDGYWLLSALLKVPNLQQTSMLVLLERLGFKTSYTGIARFCAEHRWIANTLTGYAAVRVLSLTGFVALIVITTPATAQLWIDSWRSLGTLGAVAFHGGLDLELALLGLAAALKIAVLALIWRSALVLISQLASPLLALLQRRRTPEAA